MTYTSTLGALAKPHTHSLTAVDNDTAVWIQCGGRRNSAKCQGLRIISAVDLPAYPVTLVARRRSHCHDRQKWLRNPWKVLGGFLLGLPEYRG
jgi:hypothetical protein